MKKAKTDFDKLVEATENLKTEVDYMQFQVKGLKESIEAYLKNMEQIINDLGNDI
jgi:predicted  nucleic acid-binding Zn-ribbon protein